MRLKLLKLAQWLSIVQIIILILVILTGCNQKHEQQDKTVKQNSKTNHKVTFIELGSVNCVPCKKMQPVMKNIEEKYGDQVQVIFYDVWQPNQKKFAQIYGIRLIPTQIFLDEDGHEFYRHEGFFPEYEIDALLAQKGLKIIKQPEY